MQKSGRYCSLSSVCIGFKISSSKSAFCIIKNFFVADVIITMRNGGLHETTRFTARFMLKRS